MNFIYQFLSYLGEKITKRTYLFILFATIVTIALLSGILQIKLEGAVGNIFNEKSRYVTDFKEFTNTYDTLEREIIIVIENDDILSKTSRDEITNLHLELEFLDDISSIISIASLRDGPMKDGNIGQLIADGNIEKYGKEFIHQQLYEHPIARHRLISEDGTKSVMIIGLKVDGKREFSLRDINAKAREIATQELTHSQFYFSGFLAVSAEIVAAILQDQIYFVLGGAALGFIFGYLFFRHFALVMATAIPSILSILLTLGAMGWMGISINVMTNVVPTIIMVIAFADSMHMVDSMRGRLEQGETPAQAVKYAIRYIGPACIFTSLTTSVAFLSLTFANTPIVADFGRAAAMGTFLALFASLLLSGLICLVLSRFFPIKLKLDGSRGNGFIHKKMSIFSRFVGRLSVKFAKPIVIFSVILLIFASVLHYLNEPEYKYSENLPGNNPATYAIKIIDRELGGINSFYYIVLRQDGQEIDYADPKLMPMLRQLNELIETTDTHTSHSSIVQISDWLSDGDATPSIDEILEILPAEFSKRFIAEDKKSVIVSAFTADLGAAKLRPFLRDMRDKAEKIVAQNPEYTLKLTGLSAMSAEESFSMIGELNNGLLIAMVIIILLMGVVFRSSFYAFASILPNLLPIVAGGALLYFMADGLQFTTVIALTIAFGIAVDDSIHFLYQYRQNIKQHDSATAIDLTLKQVGPVLMATTFMLSAGLGLLFLSDLPQLKLFGTTIIFILNFALLADIAILPSIFYIRDRKK